MRRECTSLPVKTPGYSPLSGIMLEKRLSSGSVERIGRATDLAWIDDGPVHGPIFRAGIVRSGYSHFAWRAVTFTTLAWSILLTLSAMEGSDTGGHVNIPFLRAPRVAEGFLPAFPPLDVAVPLTRWQIADSMVSVRPAPQVSNQRLFHTAIEAAQALVHACEVNDVAGLTAILGAGGRELISSGDEVADRAGRERLARAFRDAHRLMPEGQNAQFLSIGVEDWRFPIPIVKRGNSWQFETFTGKQELMQRRIESNHQPLKFAESMWNFKKNTQVSPATRTRCPGSTRRSS